MKKLLLILLSAALLLSLAACGGTPAPAEPEAQTQAPASEVPETPAPAADGPQTEAGTFPVRTEKMTQEEADAIQTSTDYVTLETALGTIRGVQRDGYREFRGVRYAAAERWEYAEPVTGWDGVYDATRWGDRSYQFKGFYGYEDSTVSQFYANEALISWDAGYSDDSLNLNIFTPDDAEGLPVLLYIHGGSYLNGSNVDVSTDGEAYARRGVITVSINYRLGPFASVYGDGIDGDFALTDQLTAIRWVRDNIADYGGDPSRITVMGESAGATSVQNLLVSPLTEDGLIHGAIMLSGGGDLSANDSPTKISVMEAIWDQIKEAAEVETLHELKDLPPKELFELWALNLGAYSSYATHPVLNGVALTDTVNDANKSGAIRDVPCIIGVLSEDMYPYLLYSAAMGYGKDRARAGGQNVYLYFFDRTQPGDSTFGAFHAADLYYAFGTLYRNWRPFNDTDFRISQEMIDYISNFVKTGDPNGGGLAVWEPATAERQSFLHFGDEPTAMIDPDPIPLSKRQNLNIPFPFTSGIKKPDGAEAVNKIAIAPDDMLGEWIITGWNVMADGSFAAIAGHQTFEFEDGQVRYLKEGELASASNYTWEDEFNIGLRSATADPNSEPLLWTVYLDEEGKLLIEDPTYMIVYVCVRPDQQPTAAPASELAQPFYSDGKAISEEALQGAWSITGWIVKANESFSPVTDQRFEFEGSALRYYTGSTLASTSTYYFEDDWNIGLRAHGAAFEEPYAMLWTLYTNDKGQLLIEDPTYDIIYVCERIGEAPEESGLPRPFYDDCTAVDPAALEGVWNITGWTVKADGSFAAVAAPSTFEFRGSDLFYAVSGAVQSTSTFYFDDSYNIGLRAHGAAQSEAPAIYWTLSMNDKGQLLIEDPTYDIIYVCERQT